jgi:hypothetical protein
VPALVGCRLGRGDQLMTLPLHIRNHVQLTCPC